LFVCLSVALGVGLAAMAAYATVRRVPAAAAAVRAGDGEVAMVPRERRHAWTMPPLALLERPVWSPGRRAAMLLLRGYLVVAVALLVVKTVQLGH
jgi:hypothetical protein